MNSFNVVVPTRIHRVTVRHRVMPGPSAEGEVTEDLMYDGGFSAGYEAGQWKARKEASEAAAKQAADVASVLKGLHSIQVELLAQAKENFRPLLMSAVERVFKHHRISEEEMANEIAELLKEVAHAQSICIECCPSDLDKLQKTLEGLGLMLQKGVHSWKANPTLKSGEFILQTDLGTLDGRRICKLNKIKAALQME